MDGISFLSALSPALQADLYRTGNAHGWLVKSSAAAATPHYLAGRLYLAKSGWLLLSVPNALVRGVFDAMTAAGAELPRAGLMNVPNVDKDLLNAHISVMTADEANKIGADSINERGQTFRYVLGPVKEIAVKNIDGISKVWAIQVSSPELSALRKSYGLSALPKDEPFHITVAVRRTGVLQDNAISKSYETSAEASNEHSFRNTSSRGELKAASDLLPGGAADNMPDSEFSKKDLITGVKDEREHTNNDQIAKEIAKDHLQEDPAYYKKEKLIQQPDVIAKLREAKEHSDARRYAQKNNILQTLMSKAPNEWVVDDPLPYHMGVTHTPTKFRFHADPAIIPVGVKVRAKAAEVNPYWAQLFNTDRPILVDKTKSLWPNFFNHLKQVKTRGDQQLRMQQNDHAWRAELIPGYRQQMNLAIARGQFPRQNAPAQFIQRHGDSILSMLSK